MVPRAGSHVDDDDVCGGDGDGYCDGDRHDNIDGDADGDIRICIVDHWFGASTNGVQCEYDM